MERDTKNQHCCDGGINNFGKPAVPGHSRYCAWILARQIQWGLAESPDITIRVDCRDENEAEKTKFYLSEEERQRVQFTWLNFK